MILSTKITVQELSKAGKEYNWSKHACEGCKRNMWGHGFASRYFSGIMNLIYVKRYRCPGCKIVVTARPEGYWPRIRSSIPAIFEVLHLKLNSGIWPINFSRQRGGHWLSRFVGLAKMEMQQNLSLFLHSCYTKNIRFLT